jgi:hypothetical protein
MRLSVQFRTFANADAPSERWRRSIYVDPTVHDLRVRFADLTPAGPVRGPNPPLADIRDILFVVDRTNTRPGSSGTVWISSIALQR